MSERRAYRITGRVQGVGFRWWARNIARAMDLRGTVRNAEDGSVVLQVEGAPTRLESFEEELREGPPSARVRDVRREEPGDEPLSRGFEIVH